LVVGGVPGAATARPVLVWAQPRLQAQSKAHAVARTKLERETDGIQKRMGRKASGDAAARQPRKAVVL
jgi:hypothetical protein